MFKSSALPQDSTIRFATAAQARAFTRKARVLVLKPPARLAIARRDASVRPDADTEFARRVSERADNVARSVLTVLGFAPPAASIRCMADAQCAYKALAAEDRRTLLVGAILAGRLSPSDARIPRTSSEARRIIAQG